MEAVSLPKPATDLANNTVVLVTERPVMGNEKLAIHSMKVVTHVSNLATQWICYWLDWSLASKAGD